jgi:3-hydroxybutyryl-CoA dehydrogenase
MSGSERSGIAVLGAGLMGHGIAQVFACAGYDVRLFDSDADTLAQAPRRIRANLVALGLDTGAADQVLLAADLDEAVAQADFVFECVREDLETKQALFAQVESLTKPDAVLATNTSVIPITQIMRGLARPERALGTHWWNPPYIVPLVEVIGTEWTSEETTAETIALLEIARKKPVRVARDVPGFIGNRLQHALWREAIALVEDGICDASTIDLVVKNSFGPRLGILGPMENADMVGLDLTLAVHRTLFPHLTRRTSPSPYLEELVAAERLGMKTGHGFLDWSADEGDGTRTRLIEQLRYGDTVAGLTKCGSSPGAEGEIEP